MTRIEEIEQKIDINDKKINAIRDLLSRQQSISFNLFRERSLEKRRISKLLELCRTGK